jgi:hypothetical protein
VALGADLAQAQHRELTRHEPRLQRLELLLGDAAVGDLSLGGLPPVSWTLICPSLRCLPRLGQASFRLAVLEPYGQQCAITTEHSLPVIDAAHIRPGAAGGAHAVQNGLPLRRDLHRLFDLGYVTVRPDLRFAVSRELRDDYANGRVYHELDGRQIQLPADPAAQPDPEVLAWHEATVYRSA